MTPGARAAAAMTLMDAFNASDTTYIDALLATWARGARYAGSKDRAAVSDLVFGALRLRETAGLGAPVDGSTGLPDGRAVVLGALRLGALGADSAGMSALSALADGGPHRPAPLSEPEADRLRRLPDLAAARWAASERADADEAAGAGPASPDLPLWLAPLWRASLSAPTAEARALTRRAPFDLRVNLLKGDVAAAAAALRRDGVAVEPAPISPVGLRVCGVGATDRPKLRGMVAYAEGLVEPQDAASQAIALIAAAAAEEVGPGALLLDYCAGGGGKTLALAASAPSARLCAYDVAPARMADLSARLERAGARAERMDAAALAALEGRFDVALVDAPCSGSGAWARRPDAKWRLTSDGLTRVRRAQQDAIAGAVRALRPGGMLIYATCSLLACENLMAAQEAVTRDPRLAPTPLAPFWRQAGLSGAPPEADGALGRAPAAWRAAAATFSPAQVVTDGFFVAALRKGGG